MASRTFILKAIPYVNCLSFFSTRDFNRPWTDDARDSLVRRYPTKHAAILAADNLMERNTQWRGTRGYSIVEMV